MPSRVKTLTDKGLIKPPKFVPDSILYEVVMGSVAYGVSDNTSDMDVYGFCVPPRHIVFPHEAGVIHGFDKQVKGFDQFTQHHVKDSESRKEYDFAIYNIVKYFRLVMDNNLNMVDTLFVPRRCILHSTRIGEMVRENRRGFLHKGAFHKFKGYGYSQMHKMRIKNPKGKRKETVEKFGYDVKFAYHIVRLMLEIEMILTEHDLDLERNREQLKSIRRGEWTMEQVEDFFAAKEKLLEAQYLKSDLPYAPDESWVKGLLLDCLEEHYGSLGGAVEKPNQTNKLVGEIEAVLARYSG